MAGTSKSLDALDVVGEQAGTSSLTQDQMAVRQAAILTATFGGLHALLLLLSFWLLKTRVPALTASDAETVAFYSDPDNRQLVLVAGIYLIPFAAISFIWFIVAIRQWASEHVDRRNLQFANVQLVAGIIYISLLLGAGAAMSIVATGSELSDTQIDPVASRQFLLYGVTLSLTLAMRMAAMVTFTTTSLLRRAGVLPGWFLVVGVITGLLLLFSASISSWLIVVFPTWLLLLSAILFRIVRRMRHAVHVAQ